MRTFQCLSILALLAFASGQFLTNGYLPRSPKQMTDSALHKILSAIRGGGRGHREMVALTGSGSNPSASLQSAPSSGQGSSGSGQSQQAPVSPQSAPSSGLPSLFGFGRSPQSITHVPPPPKIGAFFITPPERNAPYFYSGSPSGPRRPLFKFGNLRQASQLTLLTAESANRPGMPPPRPFGPFQFVPVNGPITAAASSIPSSTGAAASNSGAAAAATSGKESTIQEIVANAAQKQHAAVLEKEKQAHPNAQINSQIAVPGAGPLGPSQPVYVNQYNQPFLAPALFTAAQQGAPQQQGPPQFFGAPGMVLLSGPPPPGFQGRLPPFNNVVGEIPEHLLKAQQNQQGPPQLQFLNPGLQIQQQGQRIPIPLSAQQIPGGGQILTLPPGSPHMIPGQFAILPQNAGGPGFGGFRGISGPLIPGNAIVGQPHFAIYGGPASHLQGQNNAAPIINGVVQQGKSVEKEEQPTRPLESSSSIVESVVAAPVSKNLANDRQMTAAIMQSQVEFTEPIAKAQ